MAAKWQDWASFTLGLWLALSPWLAGYVDNDSATANSIFVGLALALCSHFECVACNESAEWLNLGAGVWLLCAPYTLDYASGVATVNSIMVGGFIAGLAASALSLDKVIGKLWHRAH